jgi:hypothetical protein
MKMLYLATVVAALSFGAARGQDTAQSDAVRTYMTCVRSMSARIEPSEEPPEEVAKAAIFVCQREELAAINASLSSQVQGMSPDKLRATAIYYGASQAVLARLCRRAGECKLAPPPAYTSPNSN